MDEFSRNSSSINTREVVLRIKGESSTECSRNRKYSVGIIDGIVFVVVGS